MLDLQTHSTHTLWKHSVHENDQRHVACDNKSVRHGPNRSLLRELQSPPKKGRVAKKKLLMEFSNQNKIPPWNVPLCWRKSKDDDLQLPEKPMERSTTSPRSVGKAGRESIKLCSSMAMLDPSYTCIPKTQKL